MNKRKMIIIITVIIALIITLGGIVVYKNINDTKKLQGFKEYVEGYKKEMSNYIIDQHKNKYEELVATSEKVVESKDVKSSESLKEELTKLKEEIVQANLDLINTSITELENVDISKLEDKESIEEKIADIKKLRDNQKFKEASEISTTLNGDINKKLEIIRLEEEKRIEEEKNKAEEEAKRLEKEKKDKDEFLIITELVLYGLNAGRAEKYNLNVNPVRLESYQWTDGQNNYEERKAVSDLSSSNTFLLTAAPFNSNEKPEKLLNDDLAYMACILEKNEEYYLIQYQPYWHILTGGNGDRFNRKVYLNGSVEGNGLWNEPYSKIL